MSDSMRSALRGAQNIMQRLAMLVIVLTTLCLMAACVAAALGELPWLQMSAQIGDVVYPRAGMAVQIAVTALLLTLCFYLPSNARMLALEQSHRSFHIGMRDVARAYAAAHNADRTGAFTLSSEFDSIRERIEFLRTHPDLRDLEPSVIEVAAQMSHISRELADTYSDNNVNRARDFLIQRQQEVADFTERLSEAKAIASELTRWHEQVALDESVARSQMDWLRDELAEILPELAAPTVEEAPVEPEGKIAEPVADDPPPFERDDQRIVELLQRRQQLNRG